VLLNVTDPTNRGTALALLTVLDDVGRGAGPFVVAQVASHFGRRATFAWSTLGWVLCGLIFGLSGFTLKRDERAMQERLRKKVLEAVDEEEGGGGGESGGGGGGEGSSAAVDADDCCGTNSAPSSTTRASSTVPLRSS
jgi:hypothetical protein